MNVECRLNAIELVLKFGTNNAVLRTRFFFWSFLEQFGYGNLKLLALRFIYL